MSETANGKFKWRAFISVLSAFTFIAMGVTGLVIFFAPSCRIARDISWAVWGYSKEQWTAVHVWFSLAFVIASAFHIYLNWAALTSYFRNKVRQGLALRTEWVAALAICAIIGLGTIYQVAPFSSLVAYQDTFKHSESGSGGGGQGGYRGGRGAGLGQSTFGLTAGSTARSVSGQGCERGAAGSCETATKSCGTEGSCQPTGQPQNLMQQLQQEGTRAETQAQGRAAGGAGFGMGQKTLRQFCTDEGIALSWALARLRSQGFTARETMTMREIADAGGVHPRVLRSVLQPE